ncbi:hypothetical protein SLS58_009071 [Diplodia intermedia]|uniref:Rhodopsin domain-containing protein n=1 Tax=Diplodia intermedia TaxID=856260 RepID=A0ABR3TET8_9PEZI
MPVVIAVLFQSASIAALNVTATACGYEVRDKSSIFSWVSGVGAALCYVATALRLYTRYFISEGGLQLDDWASVATAEHLYVLCTTLVKVSLLLFYLRIFPDAGFRKVVWGTLVLTLCFGTGGILVFAFQCTPINHAWHGWDDGHPGSCVNLGIFVLTCATLNIVLDFWVIVLPIPGILKLQSSIRTKLQIVTMFCTGFFVTGVSIYRAVMVRKFATKNPTWDYFDGGYWSMIEIDVSIICNCMPAIRKLLGHVTPKLFGSTQEATTEGPSRTAGRSARKTRGFHSFGGSAPETESVMQLLDIESRPAVSLRSPREPERSR